jgi:hypothetical protein
VSDFTSGTVTSASTAQQAGTALFATNASTAVFATTSGTATTISGTITKSQVSDFTSGTVTSASTAQQSGTALFAVNSGTATYSTTSGTALTISGDITRSQVSDFTSGTVASAGTAQQSGTAVFSNTSGTATFATNASTAVSVSGSAITQSQVVNLVSDLANTAKLDTANTFTVGGHVINSSDVNAVPLAIRNATGQNGNSFEIRNNAGTPVFGIFQTGTVFFGPSQTTSGSFISGISGRAFFNTTDAATSPLIVRGASGQTADLLQLQNNSGLNRLSFNLTSGLTAIGVGTGNAIANFNTATGQNVLGIADSGGFGAVNVSNGTFYVGLQSFFYGAADYGAAVNVQAKSASTQGIIVRGRASASGNLQEWQSSAASILTRISSSGQLVSDQQTYIGSGATSISNTRLNVATGSSSVIGQVIRGASGQTADLLNLQDSSGTILASVGSSGIIKGDQLRTLNNFVHITESNSGGSIRILKATAAAAPLANEVRLQVLAGTTINTLKLVAVGPAGTPITILDNLA